MPKAKKNTDTNLSEDGSEEVVDDAVLITFSQDLSFGRFGVDPKMRTALVKQSELQSNEKFVQKLDKTFIEAVHVSHTELL